MNTLDLLPDDVVHLDREICKRSLMCYASSAAKEHDPHTDLQIDNGFHRMCDAVQSAARSQTGGREAADRLMLLSSLPLTYKTTLSTVMLPTWLWGPLGLQSHRILVVSHAMSVAAANCKASRELMMTPWFQRRWPVQIQDALGGGVGNDMGGVYKMGVFHDIPSGSFDTIIIDDPMTSSDVTALAAEHIIKEAVQQLPFIMRDEDSHVIVSSRRYGYDDVLGVMNRMGIKATQASFPAMTGEIPTFPERYSEPALFRHEQVLGKEVYKAQFELDPAPPQPVRGMRIET